MKERIIQILKAIHVLVEAEYGYRAAYGILETIEMLETRTT